LGSVRHDFVIFPNQTGTATSSPSEIFFAFKLSLP
jgi:hypothetical protein